MRKGRTLEQPIDWGAIAAEVVLQLKGEPRTKSPTEWRWGNKGSFAFYVEKGTFRDYEEGVSGGVLDMVSHCEALDKGQAIQWLKENGFLPQTPASARIRPQIHRPKPTPKPTKKRHDPGSLAYGLKLWNQSLPVSMENDHPVRLWSRGLISPQTPMPAAIRFHTGKRYVVCCVATLVTWLDVFPEMPKPEAVQAVAIDSRGNKRFATEWNGNDKHTFGRVDGCGLFIIGDPNSDRINLCEGVKDALAIYQREPGAVIAPLTTFAKLVSHHSLIKYIAERNPVIFPDMDEAGNLATKRLTRALNSAGATVKIRQGLSGDDPADSARREGR